MSASMRASLATLLDPPSLRVLLQVGDAEIITRATAVSITNNLFGEGHLPYADRPDGGVLGVYVTVARERGQLLRFFLNAARGRWRDNPHVEIHEGEKVALKLLSRSGKRKCVIDGELLPLARETTVEIHKKVLNVLVPARPREHQGAAGRSAFDGLSSLAATAAQFIADTAGCEGAIAAP
jgi:diacylglycerol kinase family enzyme